jgi:hypothetical protein
MRFCTAFVTVRHAQTYLRALRSGMSGKPPPLGWGVGSGSAAKRRTVRGGALARPTGLRAAVRRARRSVLAAAPDATDAARRGIANATAWHGTATRPPRRVVPRRRTPGDPVDGAHAAAEPMPRPACAAASRCCAERAEARTHLQILVTGAHHAGGLKRRSEAPTRLCHEAPAWGEPPRRPAPGSSRRRASGRTARRRTRLTTVSRPPGHPDFAARPGPGRSSPTGTAPERCS